MLSMIEVESINCIKCGEKISKINHHHNIKIADWTGYVEIFHMKDLGGCFLIGCCLSCAKDALDNNRLIKVNS